MPAANTDRKPPRTTQQTHPQAPQEFLPSKEIKAINIKTLNFLKELKLNNSKEWLDENRKLYENAKNDILNLASELITFVSFKDKTPNKTDYYII